MRYGEIPCVNSGVNIEWIPEGIDKNKSHSYIHCFGFHKAIIPIIIDILHKWSGKLYSKLQLFVMNIALKWPYNQEKKIIIERDFINRSWYDFNDFLNKNSSNIIAVVLESNPRHHNSVNGCTATFI